MEADSAESKQKALDVLQELVTNVQFANDEGDPGMGLELGIDTFCAGGERVHRYYHTADKLDCIDVNFMLRYVEHLMGVAYDLMGREEYAKIIRAHLKKRKPGQVFKIQ